ncbi:hypothetical protein [Micromonospora sp. HK10]|nr:hypothetical protein [Micromonospora sp. HK10]
MTVNSEYLAAAATAPARLTSYPCGRVVWATARRARSLPAALRGERA